MSIMGGDSQLWIFRASAADDDEVRRFCAQQT